jgi:hypothetical protein
MSNDIVDDSGIDAKNHLMEKLSYLLVTDMVKKGRQKVLKERRTSL